jgi:hypothetical protein
MLSLVFLTFILLVFNVCRPTLAATGSVCTSGVYKDLLFLSTHAPAESYCSAHFPLPTVTATVTATVTVTANAKGDGPSKKSNDNQYLKEYQHQDDNSGQDHDLSMFCLLRLVRPLFLSGLPPQYIVLMHRDTAYYQNPDNLFDNHDDLRRLKLPDRHCHRDRRALLICAILFWLRLYRKPKQSR